MNVGIFARWARKYFEQNFAVIPCYNKAPVLKGWTRYAYQMPRESEISTWESQYSSMNVGVVLGPASNLIALDLDDDFWIDVKDIPRSLMTRKGARGEVRLFRIPAQATPKDLQSWDLPAFQFLAVGRQVILPPSIHPDTKKPYVWLSNELDHLEELPIDILRGLRERLSEYVEKTSPEAPKLVAATMPLPKGVERLPTETTRLELVLTTPGRNNRLKSVAQAILKRGDSVERAIEEVLLTDLREHCFEDQARLLGIFEEFDAAWREVHGVWLEQSRAELDLKLRGANLCPLFWDRDEPYIKHGAGKGAASAFVHSLAKTELSRGLTVVPLISDEREFVVNPEVLEPEKQKPKSKKSTKLRATRGAAAAALPQIQRPGGVMGRIYDECIRQYKGEFNISTLAVSVAASTLNALVQQRFVPDFGTSVTSAFFVTIAPSGVGKTFAADVGRRILKGAGLSASHGWKSATEMQNCLLENRNQIVVMDEASSFLAIVATKKPHAVELQDNLTRLFTHSALADLPFAFASSVHSRTLNLENCVNSPALTFSLITTKEGFVRTASDSIGEMGFMARALGFYQRRHMLGPDELDELQEFLGPPQIDEIILWAEQFIKTYPIEYRTSLVTNEANHTGAHSIERGAKQGSVLSAPLGETGPRHYFIKPREIVFDEDCKQIIKYERREALKGLDGEDEGGALESRFGEWVSRLAMLHAIGCERTRVTIEDLAWALDSTKIMLRDMRSLMNEIELPRSTLVEQKVLQQVSFGRSTIGEVKKSMKRSKFSSEEIATAFTALVRDGSIVFDPVPGARVPHYKVK